MASCQLSRVIIARFTSKLGIWSVLQKTYKSYQAVYISLPQLNINGLDHIGRIGRGHRNKWPVLLPLLGYRTVVTEPIDTKYP